jgi:hypothetical protein
VDRYLLDRATDVAQGSKKFQVEGEATAFEPSMDSGISRGGDEFQAALTVIHLGIKESSNTGREKTACVMADIFSVDLSTEHADTGREKGTFCS